MTIPSDTRLTTTGRVKVKISSIRLDKIPMQEPGLGQVQILEPTNINRVGNILMFLSVRTIHTLLYHTPPYRTMTIPSPFTRRLKIMLEES